MNGTRFYLKTTSKIVLPLLFSTKNLSELFLGKPEGKRSVNSIKRSVIQTCKRLIKHFGALDVTGSHALKTVKSNLHNLNVHVL